VAQMVLPPCLAWTVQRPVATSVTVVPETVQTGGVVEVKLTVSPEVAVALTVNGAEPKGRFGSAPKTTVWLSCVTRKLWLTGTAVAQFALPPCLAWTVQRPVTTNVTVVPDTVQTGGVYEVKLTARPEVAVALTVNGGVPNG